MTLTGGPHLQVRQREEWRVVWLGRLGRLGRLGLREKEKRGEEYCWLNFTDSFQFLLASLAKLVSLCPTMPLTQSLPYPESVKSGKGVFPYSFLDAEEKLLSTSLPPQEAFFDTLSRTPLSNEDYARAQEAWEGMRCTIFQDYMEGKIVGNPIIILYLLAHMYIYHVLLQDT